MSANKGLRVLAHPVVATCLVGWWANDHVLKDRFHNGATGKLSDVLGLVVFPLLLAALLEPFVGRPHRWGVAATTTVFVGINLSAEFAGVVARGISPLMTNPTLTPDASDLLVLPALFGSWWLWERTALSTDGLRRFWGGVVLALGLGVTMATSDDFPSGRTEVHRGAFVLEGAGDHVELGVDLFVGEQALPLANVEREFTVVPTGVGPAEGDRPRLRERGLGFVTGQGGGVRDDLAPIVEVSEVDRDPDVEGVDAVRFELVDDRYGAVIVQWSMFGACWDRCDSDVGPLLTIDESDAAGRQTFDEVAVYRPAAIVEGQPPINLRRWTVTVPTADHRIFVHMPYLNTNSFRAASEHQSIRLGMAGSAEIELPPDCGEDGCSFDVWVGGQGDWSEPLLVYANPGVEVTGRAVELVATEVGVPAQAIEFVAGERTPAQVVVHGVEPKGFPAEVTTYVDIVLTRRGPDAAIRQGFTADYARSLEIGWRQRRGVLWGANCCVWPTDLIVNKLVEDGGDEADTQVGEFMGRATIYSLEPLDEQRVSVRLTPR